MTDPRPVEDAARRIVRVRNEKSKGAFITYAVRLDSVDGPLLGAYSDFAGFEPSHLGARMVAVVPWECEQTLLGRWRMVRRAIARQLTTTAIGQGIMARVGEYEEAPPNNRFNDWMAGIGL